jgi:cysteine-S-conjugate beta-lyase
MTRPQFTRVDPVRLRTGFGVKWGSLADGTIGAWVADMDFGIPPAVRDRMIETVEREDFGYPFWTGEDQVIDAFQERMSSRYQWVPTEGRTRVFTDLIQILQVAVEHATAPGDGIALHVPTYPPFLASIIRSGRHIIPIPMCDDGTGWCFHSHGLAETLRRRNCRMLVLANPHNPTGRVFSRTELGALASVADQLDLTVFADEIHADLSYPPHVHVPFASLDETVARRTITATSATKAFNLAAVRCAVAHIGPAVVKARLDAAPLDYFGQPSILSRVATVAAWRESGTWLAELMEHLTGNRDLVVEWARSVLGARACRTPEATYLAWLDLTNRPLGPRPAERIERAAGVKLSDGSEFSDGTDVDTSSFVRLNFATSPDILRQMLTRISDYAVVGTY